MCAGGEVVSDVLEAAQLLERLLLQDVQEVASASGKTEAKIKEGTERDRIPSATDPEQRHGHKSHSRHFTGHKASVAVHTDSQVIAAVEVLPGNAPDATGLMELVEQAEAATELPVEETIGDCAYGSAKTLFQLMIAATIANLRLAWNFEQAQNAASKAIRASCALICAAFCRAIVSPTRTAAFVIRKPFVLHPGLEPRIRHEYA